MRSLERDYERLKIEQRFIDMNRQIGELTSIVKALTEKILNSKEGNNQDVLNTDASYRSDSVISNKWNGPSQRPLSTLGTF